MKKYVIISSLLTTPACTTLDDSIKLGGSLGAVTGAAAIHAAYAEQDKNPSSDTVTSAAAIGLTAGLITSYLTHKSVQKNRENAKEDPNIYFGDLPPNPFVVPRNHKKGGK